jgi:L-iditol 2-dehydrogenase
MKSVRLISPGCLQVFNEPIPVPRGNESLIQVKSVGICGSDIHWFTEGGIGDAKLAHPLVLGHEFVGIMGNSRRVFIDPAISCGTCEQCRKGHPNLCPQVIFAGHDRQDGALREWLAWDSTCLYDLPDSINDAEGVMLEPLGVAIHAVDLAKLEIGMTVGVFGCGPIGLLIIQLARLAGARQIIATDPLKHRGAAAQEIGADQVFQVKSSTNLVELFDSTAGRGVDVSFDASGSADAVNAAFQLVIPGGKVMLIGIPDDNHTGFDAALARRKGLTIKLVRRMKNTFPRALNLVERHQVDVKSIVSHQFSFDMCTQAFKQASKREGLKILINL